MNLESTTKESLAKELLEASNKYSDLIRQYNYLKSLNKKLNDEIMVLWKQYNRFTERHFRIMEEYNIFMTN